MKQLFLLFTPLILSAQITHVQSAGTVGNQLTVTPKAVGDLIVVFGGCSREVTLKVADSAGHAWTVLNAPVGQSTEGVAASWYAFAKETSGTTISVSGCNAWQDVMIDEFSGIEALDASAVTSTIGNGNISKQIVLQKPGELVWSGALGTHENPGTGFSEGANDNSDDGTEYQISTSTEVTVTFPNSGTYIALIAAFTPGSPSGYSISGSAGIVGATVTLSGTSSASTSAGSNGVYSFSELANGAYTISPSLSGYLFNPASQTVTISGNNLTGVNFSAESSPGSWTISGVISPSSAAASTNVILTGAGTGSASANSSGDYSLADLANGVYSVSPISSSYAFSPVGQTLSIDAANSTGINFSGTAQIQRTYAIAGTISPPAGDGGTVTLGGSTNAVTEASSSGAYSFTGLSNGSYTVTPANSGYSFSPPSQSIVVSGENANAVNFNAAAGFLLSGTLTPPQYAVGATVTLTGPVNASTTVTGSGKFSFAGLPAGTYTVTPTNANATFTPLNQKVTIAGQNTTVSFTVASSEKVIFFDNFTQPALSSAWTVIQRHGEYAQGETECNIPQEVVTGSGLTISTAAANWTCGDFNTDKSIRHSASNWPYITGDVQWTTQSFTYGTVETRAKFPSSKTNLWPAIWMLGSNCQQTNIYTADTGYSTCPNLGATGYIEIDMVECFSGTWCQFHVANPNFGVGTGCGTSYPVDTNWHTYDTVWTSSGIKQYMDGALVTSCNQNISNPMFLIIQTQTGGVGGTPNSAALPAQFVIDYVKVTQP